MARYREQVYRTQFILWGQHSLKEAENRADKLWTGTKAFRMGQRFLYKRQVLFSFHVAFLADIKTTSLWQILLDPCGEQPVRVGNLAGWMPLPPVWPLSLSSRFSIGQDQGSQDQEEARWQSWVVHQGMISLECGDYELCRLYAKACQYLLKRLPQAMKRVEYEAWARCQEEEGLLNEYYHQLTREAMHPLRKLFRRLAVATVRADLARSWKTKGIYADQITGLKREIEVAEAEYREHLAVIRQEMSWRLGELEARYATRIQVSLDGIACIWAPYIEFTFRLPLLPGEHRYLYNCTAQRFADTICDACEELTCHLSPCSCGNVVCDNCYGVCPGCGKPVCRDCAQAVCHICGVFVCGQCAGTCPFSLVAICPRCLVENCGVCAALAGYGWQLPSR